jgi:hypothetical protein
VVWGLGQKKKNKKNKVGETLSHKNNLGVVVQSVIPTTQETEEGGSQSAAQLGKSIRPYLKNKLKKNKKGGRGMDHVVVCLESWVQTQVLQKQQQITKKENKAFKSWWKDKIKEMEITEKEDRDNEPGRK